MPVTNKGFGELFGEAKNKLDHFQADMASVIPSFPGLPAAKYFDLAIGVDFHPTAMPPLPLFPVPHLGMVFDIMGAIMAVVADLLPPLPAPPEVPEGEEAPPAPITVLSVATAVVSALKPSVKVQGQWIANAGAGIQHLPGIIAHLLPVVSPMASSEMWMGSSTVLADGGPFSTQFHPALSCNLVGFPSLLRMNKPPKPKMSLMLPTSLLLAVIPGGPPVLVGGPPTIDLFQLLFKMGLKGLGKLWKKAKGKIKPKAPDTKTPKLGSAQPQSKCKGVGEPVDVATGKVYHTNTDFEIPGPIPLIWERTYYSNAETEGPLGSNWHHSYNMGLYDMQNGFFTLRLQDGRETALPVLALGETFFSRAEQLLWRREKEGYVLTNSEKLQYRFGAPKNKDGFVPLSSISNSSGLSIRFIYDQKGQLTRIEDTGGRLFYIEHDALGHIVQINTEANGSRVNLISYSYDGNGNLIKVADALGVSKHFEYSGHLLTKLTNQSGMSFYWEYEGKDDDSRCIHTWGDGEILEYWMQFDEAQGKTIARNSLGHVTEYHYDSSKLIYKIIDGNGGVTLQTYNEFGELILLVDAEGLNSKYKYNEWGKLVKFTNENDESTTYEYNDALNLEEVTSPEGGSVSWEYDSLGRVVKKRSVDGSELKFEYEGPYLRIVTDIKGRKYELSYDDQHNLTRIFYPQGIFQAWTYDKMGRVTSATDVKGNSVLYGYDEVSNLIWMEEPDGNRHKFNYDSSGNLIEARDRTHEVLFTYGPLGTLKSRTQNGTTVYFNYDSELQLRSVVNEGSEAYKFGLDALGNIVSEWGFDGLNRRYQRDGIGRVQKVLRPGELWTAYEYDGTNNIVGETHSDGTRTRYAYTKDGLLKEAVNEDAHLKFQRDKAGRIIKEQQGKYDVTVGYNEEGLRVSTTSSLGALIEHNYDSFGDIEKVLAKNANSEVWEASWKRDKTGLELYRELSGGITISTERDRFGRVCRRSIGSKKIEQSRIRYDWSMGNKLNRIVQELSNTQISFEYDTFDNLLSATYDQENGKETIYRIPDAMGNLYKKKDRKDRVYEKGGRLSRDESYCYHYDVEGNLIFKEFLFNENSFANDYSNYLKERKIIPIATATGWAYEWAANGMLRKVHTPAGNKVSFCYDPIGRRIAKIVSSATPLKKQIITRWLWDGNVPLHEWSYEGDFPPYMSINEQGTIEESEEPIEKLITWVFEAGTFIPCAKLIDDDKFSIVTDYLGTATHGYNSEGELVWNRELDCYGKVKKLVGDKSFCNHLYQGQYFDLEIGLAYNRFRYYDPESGNYISQDPIGLNGNNPTIYAYVSDVNSCLDIFGLNAVFDQRLANIAKQAHDVLRDSDGNPTRGFRNRTVSVAEIEINGEKQLIASGNGAKLTPAQRAKLQELGVPKENILSGVRYKTLLGDVKQTNLANHAERVIITNLPKGAKLTGKWGVSWGGRQRNASCHNCQPHVDLASKSHH